MTKTHENHHAEHQGRHGHGLSHFIGAVKYFWSSDVNRAAAASIEPKPGEVILDLGAGLGPASLELAERVGPQGQVVAVDPSRLMRAILRTRRSPRSGGGRIVVRDGTGESIPAANDSFDAAVSLNVMHHLDDIEQTVSELARVLRPGGRLLLLDEDFGHEDHVFQSIEGGHAEGPELVDPDDMIEALSKAGFADVDSRHTTIGGQPAYVVTATLPQS